MRKNIRGTGKKRKSKNNRYLLIAIIFLLIIIIAGLLSFYLKFIYKVKAIRTYEIKVKVGDHIGFDIENSSINFGTIIPGNSGERIIELSSNEDVKVEIYLMGEIAKWITLDKNDFLLKKNKNERVTFTITIPVTTKYGNYSGKAIILFKKI